MGTRVHLLSIAASCGLIACATSSDAHEQAAVIVQATTQSRAALQGAINGVFGARVVTLANDALTQDSILIIEPLRPRNAEGQLLQGRETRLPETFRLVKSRGACVLIQQSNGNRIRLSHTRCEPRS